MGLNDIVEENISYSDRRGVDEHPRGVPRRRLRRAAALGAQTNVGDKAESVARSHAVGVE